MTPTPTALEDAPAPIQLLWNNKPRLLMSATMAAAAMLGVTLSGLPTAARASREPAPVVRASPAFPGQSLRLRSQWAQALSAPAPAGHEGAAPSPRAPSALHDAPVPHPDFGEWHARAGAGLPVWRFHT